jgi:two-component system CheB/CheR fusion protein
MEKNITFPNYSMEDYHNFNQDNRESKNKQDINVQKLAQKIILDNFSWPSVLIDKNFEIHYFNGNTEKYLTQPKGKASLNLLNMARKNLRYKLTPSIHKAIHEKEKVITKDVMIEEKEKYYKVDIIVQPIRKGGSQINFLLVAFKEKGRQNSDETLYETSADEDQRVKALEQELKRTKESLQTTIEELETTNEELKSSNEELQATNEEYQSTNEELETSREEAQSTNEELTAVNSELKDKIQELSRANDDMKNLLNSTQIATIFLNTDLSIRRFTSPTSQIFNIIESDIGRPINHITSKINYDNIDEDAQEVLDTLEKQEKEIQTESGEWYSVKIMPYRTTDNLIDGVIITFTNVTRIKQAKEASRLATVVRDSNDAIMVLDLEGNILEWNKGATNIYGYQEEEALEINVSDIIPPEERSKFQELLNKIKSGQTVDSFETSRITKEGQILEVWLTITRLVDNNNNTYAIATTERDLTEIKEMQQSYEEKINELKEELKKCKKN